jgi:hypothetical protein
MPDDSAKTDQAFAEVVTEESHGERARDAAQVASHKRGWMIFFGLLLLMTIAGIALEIWFNEHQRLKHYQLDRARELWATKGSKEYDFTYEVVDQEREPKKFTVRVRKSGSFRVESDESDGERLASGEVPYLNMKALFDRMDAQLTEDEQPGQPSVFAKADFDRSDGHVVRYVRSVRATRQRIQVTVESLRSLDE